MGADEAIDLILTRIAPSPLGPHVLSIFTAGGLCPLVKPALVVILLGNFIFRSPTTGMLLRL